MMKVLFEKNESIVIFFNKMPIGNSIPIGDQKDVVEFNLCFLSRIEEGLQLKNLSEKFQ